jgi:hypothetical protein
MTVINLEESSAEDKANSSATQVEPHSSKTTSSVINQNLGNTISSEDASNLADKIKLTALYEDDMTISTLRTKISEF